MAPSDATIKARIVKVVCQLFAEGDDVTVNNVRNLVKEELDLDEDFFVEDPWKLKSKLLVKEAYENCTEDVPATSQAAEEASVQAAKPKRGRPKKRASTEADVPAKKRRKQEPSPSASESELSEAEDVSDVSEKPAKKKNQPKAKSAKPAGKKKRIVAGADEDEHEDDDSGDIPPEADKKVEKVKPKVTQNIAPKADMGLPDLEDDIEQEVPKKSSNDSQAENGVKDRAKEKKASADSEDSPLSDLEDSDEESDKKKGNKKPADDDDESSMSDVIDEPPKPKRKAKEPKAKGDAPKAAKVKKAKAPVELSPDEQEIKKLQAQIVKCGVRKIWGFELKKYGDNNKAKIRHLRDMLKDLGMDGRFSEAKAREIKEARELAADLEAVQEMDRNWGASSGRASRSRAAAKPGHRDVIDDDDDEGEEGDGHENGKKKGNGGDEESDEDALPTVRQRKARDDLAFLGDSDDEDSD